MIVTWNALGAIALSLAGLLAIVAGLAAAFAEQFKPVPDNPRAGCLPLLAGIVLIVAGWRVW